MMSKSADELTVDDKGGSHQSVYNLIAKETKMFTPLSMHTPSLPTPFAII